QSAFVVDVLSNLYVFHCSTGNSFYLYCTPACYCFFSEKKKFMTRRPSTFTWHCYVRISPIVENSSLLPLVRVWVMSQSQCG
ncbi:hypothetical protein AAZX31_08G225700, partial [Glycine max]